jgi:hypothetical protein
VVQRRSRAKHLPESLLQVVFDGPDYALDGSNRVLLLLACEESAAEEQHRKRDEDR